MFLIRRHGNPQRQLGKLQNDMDRMLQGVFGTDSPFWPVASGQECTSWPKLDVSESEQAVHVSAELPGLKQEEIEIEVLAETLHISGEKKDERVVDKHNFHSVERKFGRFDRTVALPTEVDAKNAEATFKDGVLAITLPKLTPVAAQKIAVKSAT